MSLHLDNRLSMLNTRKPKKKKITEARRRQLEVEWRQHNKQMRRQNCHLAQFDTLDDYIAYIHGEYRPKAKQQEFKEYAPSKSYVRDTTQYRSLQTSDKVSGACTKRESPVYSGERRLLGVATMHKSNMVPIFEDNKEQAVEIANMRRN